MRSSRSELAKSSRRSRSSSAAPARLYAPRRLELERGAQLFSDTVSLVYTIARGRRLRGSRISRGRRLELRRLQARARAQSVSAYDRGRHTASSSRARARSAARSRRRLLEALQLPHGSRDLSQLCGSRTARARTLSSLYALELALDGCEQPAPELLCRVRSGCQSASAIVSSRSAHRASSDRADGSRGRLERLELALEGARASSLRDASSRAHTVGPCPLERSALSRRVSALERHALERTRSRGRLARAAHGSHLTVCASKRINGAASQ